jgi:hypothetical protein
MFCGVLWRLAVISAAPAAMGTPKKYSFKFRDSCYNVNPIRPGPDTFTLLGLPGPLVTIDLPFHSPSLDRPKSVRHSVADGPPPRKPRRTNGPRADAGATKVPEEPFRDPAPQPVTATNIHVKDECRDVTGQGLDKEAHDFKGKRPLDDTGAGLGDVGGSKRVKEEQTGHRAS